MTTSPHDTLQNSLGTGYRLERELGGGGMSRVFVAEEVALGRQVVVKVLAPELTEGLSAERFAREVRLAARLQHANIVPVLTAGDTGGLPYYTMPFIRGESLRERVAREGALPVGEAVGILRDITRALAYAHCEGIVHRDIKPENVLLSGGAALVTDFGIAKAIVTARDSGPGAVDSAPPSAAESPVPNPQSLTTIGLVLGTPAYMAPEQAAGESVDHRADLYALGALAWEMLVGRPMFGQRAAHALIAAHIGQAPEDVAAHRPDVPSELAVLIMRLLAKAPDDRPATAAEVLRALDVVATPPAAVRTPSTRRPATASRRGWPRVVAAVGVPLVALVAGIVWWRSRAAPTEVSATAIAIAPFRVAGADPSLGYLREGMVDLLAAKISGIGGMRAVDPRMMLVAWRRQAGGSEDLPSEDAVRVARELGAGRLILGEIAGTSANLTVSATLLPAPAGREPPRAIQTGPADSLPVLVDRVAAQLVSLGTGEAAPRLTALTSTSLPALRAYLDGRAQYRSGQTTRAMQAFLRAVELDSNFTLAALGLVRTVGWGGQSAATQARAMAVGGRILRRGRDRLSAADAALADAKLGPRYPAPRTYAEWFAAAERLTTLAPENPEGWFELGDVLFHGGGVLGIADADQLASRAFSRVLALDSAFTLPVVHLAALYAELGDTAGVRHLHVLRARDDSTTDSGYPGLVRALLTGDSAAARSIRAGMHRLPPPALYAFFSGALYNHYGLDEAQRALDLIAPHVITSDTRVLYAATAFRVATERGRPKSAAVAVRGMLTEPSIARDVALTAVLADGDSTLGAEAARILEPIVATTLATTLTGSPPDSAGASADVALNNYVDAPLVLAQYRLALGDASLAKQVIPWLRAYVPPRDSMWLAELTAERALLLDAQVAARERRTDAANVLARLDSAAMFGHHDPRFTTLSSLVTARLWDDRGDARRALAALRRRVRGTGPNHYESTWQREVGRLAVIAGEPEAAIRAYRTYLVRMAAPEPALAPEVERVRAELARLERAGAGR